MDIRDTPYYNKIIFSFASYNRKKLPVSLFISAISLLLLQAPPGKWHKPSGSG